MADDELIAEIHHSFPGFVVHHWRALGEGWMSRALLVNDTHVFRFAKQAQASADLRKEAALLPVIAERVRLELPRFELVGAQRSGLAFVAYEVVRGEPLERELWSRLPADDADAVVQQLVEFMRALNEVPPEPAQRAGLEALDHRANVERAYRELGEYWPQLPDEVRAWVGRRFAEFVGQDSYFREPPRLLHGDLSPDHLLFDPARQRLAGVIDFGDLCLGDPAFEYRYLLEDLGAAFTARVMTARGVSDVPALLHKVSYFVTFDHVESILVGLERGERSFVEEGVAALIREASAG